MSELEELIIGRFTISSYDIDHFEIAYDDGSGKKRNCYITGGDFESFLGAMLAVKEDSEYVESHKVKK